MISERGAIHCLPFCGIGSWLTRRVNVEIKNAAVLPVPVWALPSTSFPDNEIGRVLAWMGVHSLNPASRMPCSTGSGMGRLSNSIVSDSMRVIDRRSGSGQADWGKPGDDAILHVCRFGELGGLTR